VPFDPSVISEITHSQEGSRLTLEWSSTAPAGTWYQLYLRGALAWWGTERHATVAAPRGLIDGQIGAVAAGEQTTDFADAGLDAFGLDVLGLDANGIGAVAITNRAYLAWTGFGAAEYRILEGALGFDHGGFDLGGLNGSAGTLVGTVAGLEGISTDGLDIGAFDVGGLDYAVGSFSWTSDPLTRGDWNFSVVPYNAAGSAGTPSTTSVTITAPPRPPAPNAAAKRLTYTYNATTHVVTLNWLASLG
jgi:hypothetical protein